MFDHLSGAWVSPYLEYIHKIWTALGLHVVPTKTFCVAPYYCQQQVGLTVPVLDQANQTV